MDNKLAEAEFFLRKICQHDVGWFDTRCYFSAFVSSSRSVTFAIQASLHGVDGFDSWYASVQEKLRSDPLARFFSFCRTDTQKIGFNHIVGGSWTRERVMYWFGEPEVGSYPWVPTDDVATVCQKYFRDICVIVDAAYDKFGLQIDPDQIYTPEGLLALGLSVEDVEEELGLPRGSTDIPWEHGRKNDHRLALLRRSIPGSGIKPLLERYLERQLRYPLGPYTVGSE